MRTLSPSSVIQRLLVEIDLSDKVAIYTVMVQNNRLLHPNRNIGGAQWKLFLLRYYNL